jgi:hypothetical protein
VLDRSLPAVFGTKFAGLDTGALAAAGRALVDAGPKTFGELGKLLAPDWPGHPPAALAQGIRALVPLVQVPPVPSGVPPGCHGTPPPRPGWAGPSMPAHRTSWSPATWRRSARLASPTCRHGRG